MIRPLLKRDQAWFDEIILSAAESVPQSDDADERAGFTETLRQRTTTLEAIGNGFGRPGYAGDWVGIHRSQQSFHIPEAAFENSEAPSVTLGEIAAAFYGIGIAIDAKDAATRGSKQCFAVTTAAKSAVDVDGIISRC